MTAAAARTVVQVDFTRPRRRVAPTPATARVPRVAKTLALAHRIDAMIATGELKDYADVARALGCTRSRVSQVTNLLPLAPAVQEAILNLPMTTGRDSITERQLRPLLAEPDWESQLALWSRLRPLGHEDGL